MTNTLFSNSTNFLNSYDNEAFAPQEFECGPEQPPKISDFIKRVKFNIVRNDVNGVDKIQSSPN